jgi:beta-galactosidase
VSGFDILADRRQAIVIGAAAVTLPLIAAIPALAGTGADADALHVGRDQPFDLGWRFQRGEGVAGQETPGFDDSSWRVVDLPHDWSIEDEPGGEAPAVLGPFDKHAIGGTATGFAVGGEGWYRRHFRVDHLPADARVEVLFDGIYPLSDIWLNGQRVGGNVAGYRPFALDLTPFLLRAADNVLSVRVRNLGKNSRWYSGSGLYRQVKLDVLPGGARIARWGVGAWTKSIAGGRAAIDVTTRIEAADSALQLVTRLRDPGGAVVAEATSSAAAEVSQALSVRAPRLWSPDSPALYSLETELRRGEVVVDRMVQPYGIRIVTFDPAIGMAINGTVTPLRGGCIHHDNGLLGACAYPDADARRIRLLKARGYNAIRSSHNPASRCLREACDRLGMLMIDEAFDAWQWPKLPDDFSTSFVDHWHEVIEALVLSARNSPSVILWSIGNEIPSRSTPAGVEWEWKLANAVHALDPTRPVTAALNGVLGAPMVAGEATARAGRAGKEDNASTIFLDVPGYNYRLDNIEPEHAAHPERVIYASETFPKDVFNYADLMRRAPYFLGEFVWTAMDYFGEAGIGMAKPVKGKAMMAMAGWPWVVSWCGDIDLIGQQKASSHARDVAWGLSPLEMAVQRPLPAGDTEFIAPWGWSDELPSWTWPGVEGTALAVRIYSTGDRVELLLNGAKVGEKSLAPADRCQAEFAVPFAPGRLEAIAWRGDAVIARRKLETVGAAASLSVTAEAGFEKHSDRQRLIYLPIAVRDAAGHVLPDDSRKLRLDLSGPATLVGFGSANPLAVGSFQASEAQSFRGRALAILRAQGHPGAVRVSVQAEGLPAASTIIRL